jgi:hypothetical protein
MHKGLKARDLHKVVEQDSELDRVFDDCAADLDNGSRLFPRPPC